MSEEDKIIDRVMMIDQWKVSGDIYTQDELNAIGELIDLYNKEKEKNKELEEEIMKQDLMITGLKEDRRIAVEEIQEQYYVSKDKIKENKKLKKQMGKDLDVVYIKGVYDERDKWKNKVKELLEHYKNTGYNELEEVLQELLEGE